MNRLAQELDEKLRSLEPHRAKRLELMVREVLARVEVECDEASGGQGWPEGYFEETAGALAGEEFQRAPQGELPKRAPW
ncbi:MAG: hypothetical protein WD049_07930 [Candidatus Paceibacterota bacterium]